MEDYVLQLHNISKSFPGVKALDEVSFAVKRGSVHALVGENGAGKSTLMKILYGNYKADQGEIEIDGRPAVIDHPLKAQELGLSIIFQELNLIESLSIAENIYLGRMKQFKRHGMISWPRVYEEAREALKKVGSGLEVSMKVERLSVAEKQMVEIAKALTFNAKVILMDEPSATLTEKEQEILYRVIADLKAEGITVVYISHRMEEIFRICDTVTIIRDGKIVDTDEIAHLNHETIIKKMVGREMKNIYPKIHHNPGPEVLKVEQISRKGIARDVSFSVHAGEILGIAGLVGAGRTEVCRMIFGADYRDSGKIYMDQNEISVNSPKDAIRNGIAYLTEDRKKDGVILSFSVAMNITMTNLRKSSGRFLLNRKKEDQNISELIDQFHIKTPSPRQKVMNLSGGNQQKIIVSKWLNTDAKVFIFDEPTRGIDVGSKFEIYQIMNQIIEQGKSILLISSDLPEILALSNRVIVMREGQISGELRNDQITSENVLRLAI